MNRFTPHIASGAVAALLILGGVGSAPSGAEPTGPQQATPFSGQTGALATAADSGTLKPLTNDWG
ncbi:hypothetical protein [Streptomyces sp. NPDC004788]